MTPRDFRIGYVDPFFVHPKDSNLLFVAGAKTGRDLAKLAQRMRASPAAATVVRLGTC
jgi:Ni,Fe-hydrogenase III small subunit